MSIVLHLNGKPYDRHRIETADLSVLSPFERETLSCYRKWLSPEETFIIHTSGSTGAPKSLRFTRAQLEASAKITLDAFGLKANMQALLCLSPRHIAGHMMIIRSIVGCMTLCAVEPSRNPLENLPSDMFIDFAAFVPYQMTHMLSSPHFSKLNLLRQTIIGGAPIGEDISRALKSYRGRFYETYGMSETLTHAALRDARESDAPFQALPPFTLRVDQRGCLCLRARHLPHEVITNDSVLLIDENRFLLIGRWDQAINSGGIKLFPEQIEKKLRFHFTQAGLLQAFFIHAIPHSALGQALALWYEGSPEHEDAVRKACSTLPPYERPKEFFFVEKFIYTSSQKINRAETVAL